MSLETVFNIIGLIGFIFGLISLALNLYGQGRISGAVISAIQSSANAQADSNKILQGQALLIGDIATKLRDGQDQIHRSMRAMNRKLNRLTGETEEETP